MARPTKLFVMLLVFLALVSADDSPVFNIHVVEPPDAAARKEGQAKTNLRRGLLQAEVKFQAGLRKRVKSPSVCRARVGEAATSKALQSLAEATEHLQLIQGNGS